MISFMIFFFCILSLLIDFYLLKRFLKPARRRWLSVCFVTISLATHSVVVLLSVFYKYLIADVWFMSVVVWVIFFFFLSFFSRLVFTTFSLFSSLLEKAWPRRSALWLRVGGLVLSIGIVALMGYGTIWGRNDIRVERVEIVSDQLPEAFDGFTIAQFSDTHIGNWGRNTDVIEAMVDTINHLAPNIVVQSGDLINIVDEELTSDFIEELSVINAPVYSVLGNHDLGFYVFDTMRNNPNDIVRRLVDIQHSMGWRVLENENLWLYGGADSMHRDSIMLAGVTYPRNINHNGYNSKAGGSDLRRAMQGCSGSDFSILISHSPLMFDSVPSVAKPNLTLSGHVHAMQAKITVGDWKFSPAKWLYPMYSGLYEDRGRYLYVNDGIGFVLYPMRIGAKPEVTLFTLRRAR